LPACLKDQTGVTFFRSSKYEFGPEQIRQVTALQADYGGRWFKGSQRFHHAACLPFDPLIESDPGAIPRAACGDAGGFIKKASQLNRCSEKFLS